MLKLNGNIELKGIIMAAKEHQFDISQKLDMQEMKMQWYKQKEIDTRYDFKGISKEVDLNIELKL